MRPPQGSSPRRRRRLPPPARAALLQPLARRLARAASPRQRRRPQAAGCRHPAITRDCATASCTFDYAWSPIPLDVESPSVCSPRRSARLPACDRVRDFHPFTCEPTSVIKAHSCNRGCNRSGIAYIDHIAQAATPF
jgi:hypothetical protein